MVILISFEPPLISLTNKGRLKLTNLVSIFKTEDLLTFFGSLIVMKRFPKFN